MSARPTEYKGIVFKSKSEACYAKWLDSIGRTQWTYEPDEFRSGNYVPDFAVRFESSGGNICLVIEYKPSQPTESYISEFCNRAECVQKTMFSFREEERWRQERLNRVFGKLNHTSRATITKLHDHKGDLNVYFYNTCDCFEIFKDVEKAWEAENECNVFFHPSQKGETKVWMINYGSFFEDSCIRSIYIDGTETNDWFGCNVSYVTRNQISRTRFDLK